MQRPGPQPGGSNYLDFELEIGLGRGREYPVTVLSSPAGEAHATMHFPFDELALDLRLSKLQIALLRSGGKHRRAPSEEEQAVRGLGRSLFEALFSGRVRTCYDVSLREAAEQDKGLRLKLRIRPPELSALPWELLYDPDQAEYVCLSRQTPIVRYLESPRLIRPLTVSPPLRILGMVASPQDLPVLDIEREKQRMERATQDLRDHGLLELKWLPGQTWRDLQEAMWGGPWHVFHFIGHGGFDVQADEGFIALSDDAGRMSRLNATRLGRLLADHSHLRLVLLNACEGARGSERDIYSSTASILVHRGIPAVVAMQYEITDGAAIEFARAFYRALAHGMAVDEAVVAARKAIDLAVTNTVEWGTPVLYMRTPDGVLFHVSGAPAPPPLADAELERQRRERIAGLYVEAQELAQAGQWPEALDKMGQIRDLDPQFPDPEGIAARAREEVARQEQEARPPGEPAVEARPAPKKRRLSRGVLAAIGAVALVAVLVAGGAALWPVIPATPTPTPTRPPTNTPPPTSTPRPIPQAGATRIWKKDDSVMVYVPAGTFWMGSGESDLYAEGDEKLQHEVTLDAFWIDRTEVTNAMFALFVADTGYETDAEKRGSSWTFNPSSKEWKDTDGTDWQHPYGPSTSLDGLDKHPVVHVSWNDAVAYCQWGGKRLPTEAEWEKAARSTDKRIYPWGSAFDGNLLNFCGVNCRIDYKAEEEWYDGYADTAPVGSYPGGESRYGARDMAGNVWEWTGSLYEPYPYDREDGREDQEAGGVRVLRGGSWDANRWTVRAANRLNYGPSYAYSSIGFRCARSGSEP